MPRSQVFNRDCMEAMKEFPDKFFELAIVDPPFREDNQPTQTMRGFGQSMGEWHKPPSANYFLELMRVSKNQIIHGGNYFTPFLPPNNNWIVWYKNNDGVGFSMAELFWCSIEINVKVLELRPHGLNDNKIHPTQKPVALYKWLLKNYAKEGDKILDTHLGSGSSRIAADSMGFDFWGYELEKEYFDASCKRFDQYKAQLNLFHNA